MGRYILPCLLAAGLIGCASKHPPLVQSAGLTIYQANDLPSPQGTELTPAVDAYRLGPLDKIKVEVFGVEGLAEREIQLDGSGKLTYPMVGTIDANGMTVGELAERIRRSLAGRYVLKPQVSVNLSEPNSQVVTVDGQVQEPGLYPIRGRMTLSKAVASAKGLTEFAKQQQVVVMRKVGDQRMAALYDLRAIRNGSYPDPQIYANDTVIVGDSPQRRMFKDFLALTPLLSAPLVAVFR